MADIVELRMLLKGNVGKQFHEEIFSGLTLEEQDIYDRVNRHIMENTKKAMARREKS